MNWIADYIEGHGEEFWQRALKIHGPVICFLCEYDALPKLNQTEGTCYNGDGRSGHGCGHNLLGVGAAAAAMALREEMEKGGLSGTLVVYGCPAEETLFG